MKKSLLLCAAIAATMTAGAQEAPKAKLVDITPKGLDFSQYEPGYVFKVHASDGTAGWSPKSGLYNQETFDKDGPVG